jgi:hypothetical protein
MDTKVRIGSTPGHEKTTSFGSSTYTELSCLPMTLERSVYPYAAVTTPRTTSVSTIETYIEASPNAYVCLD